METQRPHQTAARDFSVWLAEKEVWRRACRDVDLLLQLEAHNAVVTAVMDFQVRLDEEGVDLRSPTDRDWMIFDHWDTDLWSAAVCFTTVDAARRERSPSVVFGGELTEGLERLGAIIHLVASSHHVGDPVTGKSDPNRLPWYCSVPVDVRMAIMAAHDQHYAHIGSMLSPPSNRLTAGEKARLEAIRRRRSAMDEGDAAS
jgi:hypothetical protein